ncbi:hypothetical protein ETAF_ple059 (plasmid) [Edwardsiella tarda FL6-60]|uniref:Uncharacterized protein n=2 Tax=Edwardsiella TaxID=635 RepID=A0A0H3DXI0_EDWTF|nr:hypothetical protein ETAF_ple059 [Edwardsiella tarda FL6-60]AIJ06997.1 Hypothetical protein ETEE_0520 [Edwardsiella anguillarum ET080813]
MHLATVQNTLTRWIYIFYILIMILRQVLMMAIKVQKLAARRVARDPQ